MSVSADGRVKAYFPFKNMIVCDHHHTYLTLEDLIDKPMENGKPTWEAIQELFVQRGKNIPQREFCQLLWQRA